MHYYSHNIADFNHATRHLDRVERSIYRDLIELYYDLEGALPNDLPLICRKICARRDDEPQIVEAMLKEFFTLTEQGWLHDRCEREIEAYRLKMDNAARAGKASAQRRLNTRSTDVQQTFNERSTDVEQALNDRSTNHRTIEPLTIEPKEREQRASRLPADWSPTDEQVMWCKAARPDLRPQEVAERFRDYWIAQAGQKGRKADWDATWRNWVRNERPPQQAYQTAADKSRAIADALTGRNRERPTADFIDLN